jgi:hypothetical protein
LLLDEEGVFFREGVHILHWGAHVEVPSTSAASVLYPKKQGGAVLLGGTRVVLRRNGVERTAGNVEIVPVDSGKATLRILD